MTRPQIPAEELAAAAEWRAAKQHLAGLQERVRKTGELLADDYAAACQRVEDAAAAITIPDHLLTFDPDDWTSGPRGQTEQHRLAQEAWYSVRRLGWDEFLELQARQKARQATGPKGGRRRARARSTGR